MTVFERGISAQEGSIQISRPPIPSEPKPQSDKEIIEDLLPTALDVIEPYVERWAGKDWREKGLPLNGMQSGRPVDPHISWYGMTPQGGPALYLSVRRLTGEGIVFQKGNPQSKSEEGKRDIFLCWDRDGIQVKNRKLGEKMLEDLKK